MVDLWMPGAVRHSVGNTGAMDGGPARAVWHITSNDRDWTFKNELGWFTGGGASVAPHLLWDPFTGEVAQFFPADSRSLSLQNAGDVRTNRTGKYCIQIETVFTEGEIVNGNRYATVRDTPCKGLSSIVAWLRSLGIVDSWPGGAPTGFVRDTVSLDTWLNRSGHYGHNQVPGNSHVDPGPMPNLFATQPVPVEDDMALTSDDLKKIALAVEGYKGTNETHDVYWYQRETKARVDALAAKLDALEQQPLTDAQIAKIADAVATNPALAQAIADTLAARLKD